MTRLGWWARLAPAGSLLLGCGDRADTAPPSDELSEEKVLQVADFDTCSREVFWPVWLYPVLADALPPVAPPYEITHLGAELFHSGPDSCDANLGLRLSVWVGDQTPDQAPIGTDGRPAFEVLGSVIAKAESDHTGTWGDAIRLQADGALSEPIRVEETGTIWIVADSKRDFEPGGCLSGCPLVGDHVYQWSEDDGWGRQSAQPLFRVTVRH